MNIQIHGIGRSGTSLIQSIIYNHIKSDTKSVQAIYEPFLWNFQTKDDISELVRTNTHKTNSISIDGIKCHKDLPLFIDNWKKWKKHPFLMSIKNSCKHVDFNVIKFIRTSGRIELLSNSIPNSKTIYITRNPLDTIYSSFQRFSLFGGEVFPSDYERFTNEILNITLPQHISHHNCRCDFLKEVQYWIYNTSFAIDSLTKMRHGLIIPYENLIENPEKYLNMISQYLNFDKSINPDALNQKVGPITSQHKISFQILNEMEEYLDYYQNLLLSYDLEVEFNATKLLEKYSINESFSDSYRKDYGKNTYYFLEK